MRKNLGNLHKVLSLAEHGQYAVGSFSPRYTAMIEPILKAGELMQSPVIIQISQKELQRYLISPEEFALEYYEVLDRCGITIPTVLHLDHTKDIQVIESAIAAGFTSVMIDASEHPLDENIRLTKEVVLLAHAHDVSVEAELGKIGTTDYIETDSDEELYTDPLEAKLFVEATGIDALAVSVGTAHGVYAVKQPTIDFERIRLIRSMISVYLVLHGGSGIDANLMHKAVMGGVSKVNIATDLEIALLEAIGRSERMTNSECMRLTPELLRLGADHVAQVVNNKIDGYLGSAGKSLDNHCGPATQTVSF